MTPTPEALAQVERDVKEWLDLLKAKPDHDRHASLTALLLAKATEREGLRRALTEQAREIERLAALVDSAQRISDAAHDELVEAKRATWEAAIRAVGSSGGDNAGIHIDAIERARAAAQGGTK